MVRCHSFRSGLAARRHGLIERYGSVPSIGNDLKNRKERKQNTLSHSLPPFNCTPLSDVTQDVVDRSLKTIEQTVDLHQTTPPDRLQLPLRTKEGKDFRRLIDRVSKRMMSAYQSLCKAKSPCASRHRLLLHTAKTGPLFSRSFNFVLTALPLETSLLHAPSIIVSYTMRNAYQHQRFSFITHHWVAAR